MNRYSEVMGQEATAFFQDRLATLSPKPCVTALPTPGGLGAKGTEPPPRTEMPLCSFLEAV